MARAAHCALGLLAVCGLCSAAVRAQTMAGPLRPAPLRYEDSAEGLRHLLQDVLANARAGDQAKLAAQVKEMEIPNDEAWFTATLGKEQGENSSLSYETNLAREEATLRDFFLELAQEAGEFSTRKVNDAPEPGNALEASMLESIKQPTDIFFAAWRPADSASDAKANPLGYFLFVDGKFRWDSNIDFLKPRSAKSGENIVPPKVIKSVEPVYPLDARANGVEGTVKLRVRIETDGVPSILGVVAGDPSLVSAAENALREWRFTPAQIDGNPKAVETVVDIRFVLRR